MCKSHTTKGDGFCNQNLRQQLRVHENVVLLQPFSSCGLVGSAQGNLAGQAAKIMFKRIWESTIREKTQRRNVNWKPRHLRVAPHFDNGSCTLETGVQPTAGPKMMRNGSIAGQKENLLSSGRRARKDMVRTLCVGWSQPKSQNAKEQIDLPFNSWAKEPTDLPPNIWEGTQNWPNECFKKWQRAYMTENIITGQTRKTNFRFQALKTSDKLHVVKLHAKQFESLRNPSP